MLTAAQIDVLRSKSEQLLDPITDFLIEDIAKRIAEAGQLTGTAAYQAWRLQNLGVSQKQLKKEIAKRLKVSQKEAEKLLTQAAETGYNFDISRFPTRQAVPLAANSSLQQILDATIKQAQDDLLNMTQTIGFVGPDGNVHELTQAYQQACDFAFQKVSTGAQDYVSAVRDATRNLAKKGIRTIDYESGQNCSIEAATRRSVMGGMGLLQEKISEQNFLDLGCDGWEISAHAASAPDHEPIQGKQYTDKAYHRINNSLVRRIGTLNCGHSSFPIILGVNAPQYTPEELEQMREDNETGVTYNGKHYTLYECTQRQRSLERSIRKQKRKILIDEATGDKDKLQTDQIRLQVLKQEYARFSRATNLPMQHQRAEVAGFTFKDGKAAGKAAQKTVAKSKNGDILKLGTRYLNKTDRLYQHAEKIKPLPGFEDIVTHGDPISLIFKDSDGVESIVPAEEFVEILRKDPNYNGGNIRLVACQAAANGGSIPKYISREMNITVIAPTETVNVDFDGNIILADRDEDARMGIQTGEWLVFEPGKEGVKLDLYRKIR